MNALSYLGHTAQLIREADHTRAGGWILYVFHQELKLKPANHQDGDDHVLTILSRHELENGLTPRKWQVIEDHIRIAIKKGVLKCQQSKH